MVSHTLNNIKPGTLNVQIVQFLESDTQTIRIPVAPGAAVIHADTGLVSIVT